MSNKFQDIQIPENLATSDDLWEAIETVKDSVRRLNAFVSLNKADAFVAYHVGEALNELEQAQRHLEGDSDDDGDDDDDCSTDPDPEPGDSLLPPSAQVAKLLATINQN